MHGVLPAVVPQAHRPVLPSVEGKEFSASSREQNFPLLKASKSWWGVRDEGNPLLIKTNPNQGDNDSVPKSKRLPSGL